MSDTKRKGQMFFSIVLVPAPLRQDLCFKPNPMSFHLCWQPIVTFLLLLHNAGLTDIQWHVQLVTWVLDSEHRTSSSHGNYYHWVTSPAPMKRFLKCWVYIILDLFFSSVCVRELVWVHVLVKICVLKEVRQLNCCNSVYYFVYREFKPE